MAAFTKTILIDAIAVLSEKYNFSAEEAYRTIGMEDIVVKKTTKRTRKTSDNGEPKPKKAPKAKKLKPKFALPWTGVVNETLCKGIKANNALFTQCTMEPESEGARYCSTCQKQADTNPNGKPSAGTVEDRMDVGPLDYVGPKDGVKVYTYGSFLKKKKITREEAVAEAAKFGIEIPEYQFEVVERKRGRPSKKNGTTAAASDTSSGSGSDSEATASKKPKKKMTKKKEHTNTEESELYAAAQEKKKNTKKVIKKTQEEKPAKQEEEKPAEEEKPVEKKSPQDEKREKMAAAAAARLEASKKLKDFTCSKTGKTYKMNKNDVLFEEGNDTPVGVRVRDLINRKNYIAKLHKDEEPESEPESEVESEVESEEEESEAELEEMNMSDMSDEE